MSQIVEEETEIDISIACRLCLVSDEGAEMTLTDKENLESFGINVFVTPNHPTRICKNCNAILEFIQKFRKMCENSNVFLREYCLKEETLNTNPSQTMKIQVLTDEKSQELVIPDEVVSIESFQDHGEYQNIQAEEIAKEEHVNDEDIGKFVYEVEDVNDEGEHIANIVEEAEGEAEPENEHENDETTDEMWIEETCEDDDVSDTTIYVDDYNSIDAESGKTVNVQKTKKRRLLRPIKDEKTVIGSTKKAKQSPIERHVCEICGNHYKRLGTLETHRRRHFNQRPFDCELCGETFSFNFLLERHMRKHTGDRPFTCEYCDRKFVDRSTMSRHQKIHRNERAYKCDICEKTFTYYSVLKTHIMSHTGEKPYRCGICEKGFHRASDLKNHLETLQHRKDPRAAVLIQEIKRRKD